MSRYLRKMATFYTTKRLNAFAQNRVHSIELNELRARCYSKIHCMQFKRW